LEYSGVKTTGGIKLPRSGLVHLDSTTKNSRHQNVVISLTLSKSLVLPVKPPRACSQPQYIVVDRFSAHPVPTETYVH